MSDPALDSHPEVISDFLAEWDRYPTATPAQYLAREEYARRELQRCVAMGVAPLYAASSAPFADQQDALIRAMRSLGMSAVTVRLREGVEPPEVDAQGRKLKDSEKPRLRTKVGNLPFPSAAARAEAANRGRDLYRTVDVTREPTSLSLDDAIAVWRSYGYRYRADEMRGGQCTWLVMQVQPNGRPFAAQTPAPEKSRK